ncbi:hypothetical protein JCM10908_004611 [Rhodotorula pacifica]|uniref:uncharacterized protein n=1 Tax=Rhodotorula pacifica TaxID=1495444 RepID=UPI0031769566
MPPRGIPASFWRGGTSRGLLFRPEHLAPYTPNVREQIIYTALGSPDPAGRQISGLGGGVSSLSKVAIVGVPGEALQEQEQFGILPGVEWADDGKRDGQEWDLVYRFAQVGVREPVLDWTASCGNMFTAAAVAGLSLLPYTTLFTRARSLPRPPSSPSTTTPHAPLLIPLSILSASNGVLMRAQVPIDPYSLQVWEPAPGEGAEIAGVPGRDEPGVVVEMPLEETGDDVKNGLVTGNRQDVVRLGDEDGTEVTVSVLSSGLPNVFLPLSSLQEAARTSTSFGIPDLPEDLLTLPASTLSANLPLCRILETIRTTAAQQFALPLSLASPKITLVGPVPPQGYTTTGGTMVQREDADLLVRAISSGDWHATIPGTTLGALNVGAGTAGTVIHDLFAQAKGQQQHSSSGSGSPNNEIVTIRAAHAAGVAESSVRFSAKDGKPESVVMIRTAREIMRGEVLVPQRYTSAQLAEQAFAAAATGHNCTDGNAFASSSSSRSLSPFTEVDGNKDGLEYSDGDSGSLSDDVSQHDAPQQQEEEDIDSDWDETELVDERFLDPESPLGRAMTIIGRAGNVSPAAVQYVHRVDEDALAAADGFAEHCWNRFWTLEALRGENLLCVVSLMITPALYSAYLDFHGQRPQDAQPYSTPDMIRRLDNPDSERMTERRAEREIQAATTRPRVADTASRAPRPGPPTLGRPISSSTSPSPSFSDSPLGGNAFVPHARAPPSAISGSAAAARTPTPRTRASAAATIASAANNDDGPASMPESARQELYELYQYSSDGTRARDAPGSTDADSLEAGLRQIDLEPSRLVALDGPPPGEGEEEEVVYEEEILEEEEEELLEQDVYERIQRCEDPEAEAAERERDLHERRRRQYTARSVGR